MKFLKEPASCPKIKKLRAVYGSSGGLAIMMCHALMNAAVCAACATALGDLTKYFALRCCDARAILARRPHWRALGTREENYLVLYIQLEASLNSIVRKAVAEAVWCQEH